MAQVEVEYTGHKNKIGILLPVGVKNKTASVGEIQFIKGKAQKLDAEDAKLLCELDSNFQARRKKAVAKPKKVGADSDIEAALGA